MVGSCCSSVGGGVGSPIRVGGGLGAGARMIGSSFNNKAAAITPATKTMTNIRT